MLFRRTRVLAAVSAAVLLLGAAGCAAADPEPTAKPATTEAPDPEPTKNKTEPTKDASKPEDSDTVHVIAMGDMLPHDSVNQNAQVDGGWDYGQFFTGISSQLEAADVTFCNQEVPSAGESFGISGYPVFNAPVEFAQTLHDPVGCDLVNIANNHAADLGPEGIAKTREVWDGLSPSIVAGANRDAEEQRTVPVFEADGVKIALVSLAEVSNAPIDGALLNMMSDSALVQDLMQQAREKADVVLVSAHWGTEDSHEVNDQQAAFAQQLADLGADVIIGTGPHVLQPVTWLDRSGGGRTLVWYSIGNMLNTQLSIDQLTGVIAGFDLVKGDDGVSVADPTAIFTYMHYDWTPEQQAANDLAARKNLSLQPLATSDELLSRTTFGVTAEQQVEASTAILGPDVKVLAE
ncbi:MAG: CapA family protein [Leucobacter sp.]